MRFVILAITICSVFLSACGGGGGGSSADPESGSESINTCRDIKPVCTVFVSPETSPDLRAAPPYIINFQAKCSTYVERSEWLDHNGKANRYPNVLDLSFFIDPSAYSMDGSLETVIDIPFRFNYANCAGGGQFDFCLNIQGFPETTKKLASYRCGTLGADDISFASFSETGSFSIGSKSVAPDVLFPDTFVVGKTPGTWVSNNGSNNSSNGSSSSMPTVIPGNDIDCKKGQAVFQTQVCTSIGDQEGWCATSRQTSKCYREALKASNGCLAFHIDLLKQLIDDADQSAKDVCVD